MIEKDYFLKEINAYIQNYSLLNNFFLINNNSLIEEEKNKIFNLFSQNKPNLKNIDRIFYKSHYRFGNILSNLNKLIFYCEIIKCKSIILDKKSFWFIKKKIKIPINSMTIETGYYNNNSIIFFSKSDSLFFSIFTLKPEIRINYLRNEIISNLPKSQSSKEYLYIHIRGGDIFNSMINIYYSQPPLCFYKNILNNYNFSKVYLISVDKSNPVVQKLINSFPNTIYSKNSLKYDISQLINAYNIVSSISSFVNLIIQLNLNLKFLWDYDIYKTSEKIYLFHYDLYKYPNNKFTIFRMEPSSKYRNTMYKWKNNRIQRKLMIKEKCNDFFSIINKEI